MTLDPVAMRCAVLSEIMRGYAESVVEPTQAQACEIGKMLLAFPKMLSALEALEARLQECAHSLPGRTTPDRVIAIVGAVPIDAKILRAQMDALRAAREAVKP